mmetsp:Transcript_11750/g.17001  ORF Transcript_11750/g.17001 Transcript_11750/m.17001 type:complete len:236 (+) Transcript_11750:302-1009(+)
MSSVTALMSRNTEKMRRSDSRNVLDSSSASEIPVASYSFSKNFWISARSSLFCSITFFFATVVHFPIVWLVKRLVSSSGVITPTLGVLACSSPPSFVSSSGSAIAVLIGSSLAFSRASCWRCSFRISSSSDSFLSNSSAVWAASSIMRSISWATASRSCSISAICWFRRVVSSLTNVTSAPIREKILSNVSRCWIKRSICSRSFVFVSRILLYFTIPTSRRCWRMLACLLSNELL